jgi:hypothetical protein
MLPPEFQHLRRFGPPSGRIGAGQLPSSAISEHTLAGRTLSRRDPVRPVEPSGQPLWLVVLGVLAAALAIVAGLALLAARRANRRSQVGPVT